MTPNEFQHRATNIELRIDEIILDSVPAAERYQVANGVESELTARLSQEGLPPALRRAGALNHDAVDGGAITLAAGARGELLGSQLAGAIYQGLANGQAPQGKRT